MIDREQAKQNLAYHVQTRLARMGKTRYWLAKQLSTSESQIQRLVEGASVLDEVAGDGDLSHAAFKPARAIFRVMLVRRNPTDNTDICLYAARTICGMVAY